ncbi:hypothetical protein K2173_012037 [Erythroxylum novogranatense]|uniref:J domain-containing protein n=1 Tax=Erythroxylum novogranatense TaxID=1862640 RepID=A0AAV8TEU5_9ROSI|nr:hypothetical protein K2173_012037 [Erythroxylum novogranatense]
MQIPRWRNALMLKKTLFTPTLSQSTTLTTKTQFASIHSTPLTCQKWKSKWSAYVEGHQRPSKTHMRYAVRQKRADAKRALKNLVFNGGYSRISFQDEDQKWTFDKESPFTGDTKRRAQGSAQGSRKSQPKKKKYKSRRDNFSEDFGEPEKVFQATFGNRWYSWSFNGSGFQESTAGFEWREQASWRNHRSTEWDTSSETESDNESCSVGSTSERTILGLPLNGPLTLDDVKKAFRITALKWHPDKHQGPSQAMAEEKFKVCVNAYKSLCAALS